MFLSEGTWFKRKKQTMTMERINYFSIEENIVYDQCLPSSVKETV